MVILKSPVKILLIKRMKYAILCILTKYYGIDSSGLDVRLSNSVLCVHGESK